jgi:small conductance mechanosensitive channel
MLILLWQQPVEGLLRLFKIDSVVAARIGLRILIIWGLAWVGLRVVRVVSKRILTAVDDQDDSTLTDKEKRGHTLAQVVRSFGRVLIYSIAILLTLNIFIDIGPLLAGAGVAGLAIAIGAQSLVKDVIAGFFFLMEDQFTVGDVVAIAGHTGTVERMTFRVVSVRDLDGVLHIVPNGQITTVSNKTRGWSRAVVDVGVSYGADIDAALEVFRDEAQRLEQDGEWGKVMDGSAEVMGVQGLGNDSVVIRTLLRTIPGRQWQVAREFRRRIKNRLDREGIEIPFPQRTVHVRQLDPTA